jgi:hypothetical protein
MQIKGSRRATLRVMTLGSAMKDQSNSIKEDDYGY